MKHQFPGGTTTAIGEDRKMKKVKVKVVEEEEEGGGGEVLACFNENLLFEVLKHVDARTLAMLSCVNKQWHKTAEDERLCELICTKQWASTGCGEEQFRSVILTLGVFCLHSLYLMPLSQPYTSSSSSSRSSSSVWGPIPQPPVARPKSLPRLGKDAVHISLLSISYYEKMTSFNNKGE